jgi:hypothetical protein
MKALLLGACVCTPMLTGIVGALIQPGSHNRVVVRYRLFRACGAGRLRAALWILTGQKRGSI